MSTLDASGNLLDSLKDKTLLKQSALVGGHWVKAKSGAEFSVFNPASGTEIARIPNLSAEDVTQAIELSEKSFFRQTFLGECIFLITQTVSYTN